MEKFKAAEKEPKAKILLRLWFFNVSVRISENEYVESSGRMIRDN
jgi:hypothetical protein